LDKGGIVKSILGFLVSAWQGKEKVGVVFWDALVVGDRK
jgi:hypothetical protein